MKQNHKNTKNTPAKKSKKWLGIVATMLIAALLGGGGYFYINPHNIPKIPGITTPIEKPGGNGENPGGNETPGSNGENPGENNNGENPGGENNGNNNGNESPGGSGENNGGNGQLQSVKIEILGFDYSGQEVELITQNAVKNKPAQISTNIVKAKLEHELKKENPHVAVDQLSFYFDMAFSKKYNESYVFANDAILFAKAKLKEKVVQAQEFVQVEFKPVENLNIDWSQLFHYKKGQTIRSFNELEERLKLSLGYKLQTKFEIAGLYEDSQKIKALNSDKIVEADTNIFLDIKVMRDITFALEDPFEKNEFHNFTIYTDLNTKYSALFSTPEVLNSEWFQRYEQYVNSIDFSDHENKDMLNYFVKNLRQPGMLWQLIYGYGSGASYAITQINDIDFASNINFPQIEASETSSWGNTYLNYEHKLRVHNFDLETTKVVWRKHQDLQIEIENQTDIDLYVFGSAVKFLQKNSTQNLFNHFGKMELAFESKPGNWNETESYSIVVEIETDIPVFRDTQKNTDYKQTFEIYNIFENIKIKIISANVAEKMNLEVKIIAK